MDIKKAIDVLGNGDWFDCLDVDSKGDEIWRELCSAIKLAEQALKEKLDREKQPDGWISVEDGLPKEYETVLLYITEGEYVNITAGYWCVYTDSKYGTENSEWYDMTGEYIASIENKEVTRWMPLPQPLQEGEKIK